MDLIVCHHKPISTKDIWFTFMYMSRFVLLKS